jgi:tripartite-type tricarboxylate transporter receptor subunit TctC
LVSQIGALGRGAVDEISKAQGSAVVIDNRPGAGASIGYALGARAAPDGNTVVIAANSVVINPLLKKTTYDPLTSFEAICSLISSPMLFVVDSASLRDLVY